MAPPALSVPTGRQSVLAAQNASAQASMEMNAAPRSPVAPGVQVNARDPNAFTEPNQAPGTIQPVVQPIMPPMVMGPPPGARPYQGPALPMGQPVMAVQAPPARCCPVPPGFANAFTQPAISQPIPADMGHDPSNTDNAFQSVSAASLAVPPGPVCGGPCAMPPAYPVAYPLPVPVAMAPGVNPGPVPPGMMLPGRVPGSFTPVPPNGAGLMAANPGLAPVRVTPEQMAQVAPIPVTTPAHASAVIQTSANLALPGATLVPSETVSLPEVVALLNDSLYPSQREWAADRLARFDWRVHPQIVECLLLGVRTDPAPMVRIACIHSLGALHAGTTYVVQTLQEVVTNDRDPRVRQEAEQTIAAFMAGTPQRQR
jgi:hypothetical protein